MCLVQKIDKYISDMNNLIILFYFIFLIILKKTYIGEKLLLWSPQTEMYLKRIIEKEKMKNKYFHAL